MSPTMTVTAPHRAWSLFDLRVIKARHVTPHLARITLSGDPAASSPADQHGNEHPDDAHGRSSVAHFADCGFDQRIKVILPARAGAGVPLRDAAHWYRDLRALPEGDRPVVRTYTVRSLRNTGSPEAEIDIDFVLHGTDGPASAWASAAVAGETSTVTLLGPDARFHDDPGGRAFIGSAPHDLLIAGDETALPAIAAILDRLDRSATGTVLIEVPTGHDVIPVNAPAGVGVTFLPRDGGPHGGPLVQAALAWRPQPRGSSGPGSAAPIADSAAWDEDAWEVPEVVAGQGLRAWIAGEAAAVRTIRRHLVENCRMRRDEVAFMGYWRLGRSEN